MVFVCSCYFTRIMMMAMTMKLIKWWARVNNVWMFHSTTNKRWYAVYSPFSQSASFSFTGLFASQANIHELLLSVNAIIMVKLWPIVTSDLLFVSILTVPINFRCHLSMTDCPRRTVLRSAFDVISFNLSACKAESNENYIPGCQWK